MASELNTLLDIESAGNLNPVQRARLGLLKTQGFSGNEEGIAGGGFGRVVDPNANIAYNAGEARKLYAEANKPVIEATKAQVPITEQAYSLKQSQLEGSKQPLKDRYKNLLDELKRREGVQVDSATLNTAREYSKRGIPLSSGVYDMGLQEAKRPINEYYTGQTKEVGLAENEDLRNIDNLLANLPVEKAQELNKIQQAIAGIESGASKDAINQALQLLGRADTNYQTDISNKFKSEELAAARKLALQKTDPEKKYEFASVGDKSTGYVYNPQTGQVVNTVGGNQSTNLNNLRSRFQIIG